MRTAPRSAFTAATLGLAFLMAGCSGALTQGEMATPTYVPLPFCKIEWKYLYDARSDSGSLGTLDGNSVFYPGLTEEIDRRIAEAFTNASLTAADRRNGTDTLPLWGQLLRAEVADSITQLTMRMTFSIHREGETAPILDVATNVERAVIAPEDRVGIRFVGPAIDESVEQLMYKLHGLCTEQMHRQAPGS